MSFFRRWLFSPRNQPQQVEGLGDQDIELPSSSPVAQAVFVPHSDRSETLPPPPPTTSSSSSPPIIIPPLVLLNRLLLTVSSLSKILMVFTFLQIMCTLQIEHVHFLTLFSLFVPWTGFEGAREGNFAYLRLFYWGCCILLPANAIHLYSFGEFVNHVLVSVPTLSENERKELRFNLVLFNISTGILLAIMVMCLILVSRISRFRALLQSEIRLAAANAATTRGGGGGGSSVAQNNGLLTREEINQIPRFKIETKEDASEICVICQDEFEMGGEAKRLNCKHLFHAKCIDAWLERSCLCPICNGDVRIMNIV